MTWMSIVTHVTIGLLIGFLLDSLGFVYREKRAKKKVREAMKRRVWFRPGFLVIALVLIGIALATTKVTFKIKPANTAVFIDGRSQAKKVRRILWGPHTLRLEKDTYKCIPEQEFWVFPFLTEPIDGELKPKYGEIEIAVDPYRPSLPIYISISDGQKVIYEFNTTKRINQPVRFGTYWITIRRARQLVPIHRKIHVYCEKGHRVYGSPQTETENI